MNFVKIWDGYHPRVYNRRDFINGDAMVAELCQKLQNLDISRQSLEMQTWWRDHQEADKRRLKRELEEQRTRLAKRNALAKLTPYERSLLGLRS